MVLSPHRAGGSNLPAVRRLRAAPIVDFVLAFAEGRDLPHRERAAGARV